MNHLGFPIETVAVFVILSVGAIAIDLFAHRDNKPMSLKSAAIWSLFWVLISILFGAFLWVHHSSEAASLFFTGYALEKVLSVDNLFLMMAVFAWFKVPEGLRHRVFVLGDYRRDYFPHDFCRHRCRTVGIGADCGSGFCRHCRLYRRYDAASG